jgi:hypothetical protein
MSLRSEELMLFRLGEEVASSNAGKSAFLGTLHRDKADW